MTELVRKCSCRWEGGKCRLSSALEGWGCKLAEVYQYADKVGVLECPHYDETTIDRTLDDAAQLASMVHLGCPTRAELLSDFIKAK